MFSLLHDAEDVERLVYIRREITDRNTSNKLNGGVQQTVRTFSVHGVKCIAKGDTLGQTSIRRKRKHYKMM